MFGVAYYNGTIRKLVIGFGNLFNDIVVQRVDADGVRIQSIAVPLGYGPKQKWLARIKEDPNLEKKVAITIPRIGFEMTSMVYTPTRKLSSTLKNIQLLSTDTDRLKTNYVPVPYDLTFNMSIFVKNADDGAQILEQILPYFRPEFTTNIILVPEMGIAADIPIVLQNVSLEDAYEGDFDTRRSLVYSLDFIMKAYFYGPTSTSGVIKRAITNIHDDSASGTPILERITVTPAQYANGSPLFSPSANSSLSVNINSISSNSDYGFSVDIDSDSYSIGING